MPDSQAYDPALWRTFEHDGWEKVAQRYHDWLGGLTVGAIPSLLDAVGARSGVRLLDIATGPGYAAAMAAQRGAEVIGVDFSAAMVEDATRRYPGLDIREGDAEQLPFPGTRFDAVVCNFGFLHFAQPDRALLEACRVLRSGGRLGFTVWGPREELDPRQILQRAIDAFGDPRVNAQLPAGPAAELFADSEKSQAMVEAAGFLPPTILKLTLFQPTPDPDTYFEVVWKGAGPRLGSPLRSQPPDALAAIGAAVRDELRACQKDGITQLPAAAVLISAQKP